MTPDQMKCGRCCKYMKEACDAYTPFGHSGMIEPPDEILLCKECSQKIYNEIVKSCKAKRKRIYLSWRPANVELKALRDSGYVQAGPRMAAWSEGFAPDNVPDNYEIWEETSNDIRPGI